MSAKLFTYTDLLRIARATTPDRAPGPAAKELVQILLLMTDLASDATQAFKTAVSFPPFTIPRDLMLDAARNVMNAFVEMGVGALEIIEDLLPKGGNDGEGS